MECFAIILFASTCSSNIAKTKIPFLRHWLLVKPIETLMEGGLSEPKS